MSDKIAEIRARHLRAGEEMASWLWDSPLTLYADRATLLAEVERLRDGLECLTCGRIVREIPEDGR